MNSSFAQIKSFKPCNQELKIMENVYDITCTLYVPALLKQLTMLHKRRYLFYLGKFYSKAILTKRVHLSCGRILVFV